MSEVGNNNNSSFISTADNTQLIYNKLARKTAQIQSNTNNHNTTKHNNAD